MQIAQERVLAVLGLGVSGSVSGPGGCACEDMRGPEIIAQDFDRFSAESADTNEEAQQEDAHRSCGSPLSAAVVVDGDLQRAQEFLILRRKFDLPHPASSSFGLGFQFHRFFGLVVFFVFSAFIESDGGF